MCDASLAALERLLMTPRHKFGPSHEWLANWNFPPPKAWAEAQRLAAERSNQNCADSALVRPRAQSGALGGPDAQIWKVVPHSFLCALIS